MNDCEKINLFFFFGWRGEREDHQFHMAKLKDRQNGGRRYSISSNIQHNFNPYQLPFIHISYSYLKKQQHFTNQGCDTIKIVSIPSK